MAEEENKEKSIPYKVVLIGESGVGKTCIMAQFISNKFDPDSITNSTAQFFLKNLEMPDGKILTFHFWDTAGQEKYRSLAKIFYKDANVVILVYDITNSKTFNIMKEYWYEQVHNYGKKDVIYAIAANKSDMYEERQVTDDEGENFAKKIGGIFSSTSAKDDVGINQLFDEIGQKILNKKNFSFNTKEKKVNMKKDVKKNVIKDKKDTEEKNIKDKKEDIFDFEILEKDDFKDYIEINNDKDENNKEDNNNKLIKTLTIVNKKKEKNKDNCF